MPATPPTTSSLAGKKTLLVIGRAGWGAPFAAALAKAGADLAIVGLDKQELTAASEAARVSRGQVIELPTDPTKELDVRRAFKQAVRDMGRVDILINNAQIEFVKPIADTSNREFQVAIDWNMKSAYLLCQEAGRVMKEQGAGRIVNVVSGQAERGKAGGSIYAATQAGVLGMTRALAVEWAKTGVNIYGLGHNWPAPQAPRDQELFAYYPSRRKGSMDDLAAALVHLCSDAGAYTSGSCLCSEGGLTQ